MDIKNLEAWFREHRASEDELIARQNAAATDAARLEWERLRRFHEMHFNAFLENESLREFLGQTEHPDSKRQRAA